MFTNPPLCGRTIRAAAVEPDALPPPPSVAAFAQREPERRTRPRASLGTVVNQPARAVNRPRPRSIRASTIASIAADAVQLLVSVGYIPLVITVLGPERYSIVGLTYTLAAHLALLQFGLAPAALRRVAEMRGDSGEVPNQLVRAIYVSAICSAIIILCVFVGLAHFAWANVFSASAMVATEAQSALFWMGAVAAAQSFLAIAFAVLTGLEKFVPLAIIRVAHAVVRGSFIIAAVQVWRTPAAILCASAIVDLGAASVAFACARRRTIRSSCTVQGEIRKLLALGAPLAIAGIVAAALVDFEKLVLTTVRSAEEFTYYATPLSIVLRLVIVPAGLASVLVPRFANPFVTATERGTLLVTATRLSTIGFAIVGLPMIAFLPEGLSVWLGESFSSRAGLPMRVIAVALFAHVTVLPMHAMVRARYPPSTLPVVYVLELLFYVAAALYLVDKFGILGAALAWSARVFVDALVHGFLGIRIMPAYLVAQEGVRMVVMMLVAGAVAWIFEAVPLPAYAKAAITVAAICACVLAAGRETRTVILQLVRESARFRVS